MAESEECPHGMEDPNWCSICKHKDDLVIDISDTDEEYPFIAKYSGFCPECKSDIEPGDECWHQANGRNVHISCD